ncbi:MAG TPA: helix-turn-helix domain-containing protein [Thermoanaerobaculia bacterium]|jgi:AraC-like DNA-binding protein|nr:helix-turn-helix domain-containing protein [Thermoanaerobaculia bacterium]
MPAAATPQPLRAEQTQRHESELGQWEMVRRAPASPLAGLVDGTYCGWSENLSPGPCRRELPTTKVPLIFTFGAGYLIGAPGGDLADATVHGSFVVGPYDSFAETQALGPTSGVQVDLTPLGAWRLLRVSMAELAGRGAPLAEVLGGEGPPLVARLAEERGWERRFQAVDAFLLDRLRRAPEPSPAVTWAWRRLAESGGTAAIGGLAAAAGWSSKHFIERFRQQIGLAPKRCARILRFQRFSERLRQVSPEAAREAGAARVEWAGLALDCGYYDQPHLIRDCRAFAGCTPRQLLARRLPDGGWLGGRQPAPH